MVMSRPSGSVPCPTAVFAAVPVDNVAVPVSVSTVKRPVTVQVQVQVSVGSNLPSLFASPMLRVAFGDGFRLCAGEQFAFESVTLGLVRMTSPVLASLNVWVALTVAVMSLVSVVFGLITVTLAVVCSVCEQSVPVGGGAGSEHHVTVEPIASVPVAVAVLVTVPAVLRAADVHVKVHVSVALSLPSLFVSPPVRVGDVHLSSVTDTPLMSRSAALPPVVPFVSVYV